MTSGHANPTVENSNTTRAEGSRIIRLMTRLVGFGYLGYFAVTVPEFARDADIVAGWWTPMAAVLVFGPGAALMAASFLDRPQATRCAALTAVAGYFAAQLLWLLAWDRTDLEGIRSNWLVVFSGLAGLAAALALPVVWTVAVQAAASMLSAFTNQLGLAGSGSLLSSTVQEGLWSFAFSAVFVAMMISALRTARLLDDTRDRVQREAVAAAGRASRDSERARFDALVHDQVLATLLQAHRDPHDPSTARHARAALRGLDGLARRPSDTTASADEVAERLRELIATTDPDAACTVTARGDVTDGWAVPRYPAPAVETLLAATGEALRNSVLHAGPGARRQASLCCEPDRLSVVITDRGRGFDVGATPAGRLGIGLSITQRMERLPGGRSAITSRAGVGTTVELEWRR